MPDYVGKLRWVSRATDKVLQQYDGTTWADVPLYVEGRPAVAKVQGTFQSQGTIGIRPAAWASLLFQKDIAQ